MKRAMIIASLGLASLLSFGASAAVQQVNAEQAQNLQSMGTISVSQVGSAPMDMRQELAAKAEKEGASSYLHQTIKSMRQSAGAACHLNG
ncbi:MAG: YdgH/BhsA/McbA-like domain containing protein [Klebsiella pneumoniae]|nr:YdgH/BhsA/McbA-like domain containing protein [Klebsiella pneumoniae]